MATGGLLAVRLGEIQRRLRLFAVVEGGVAGAALAMLVLAVGVAAARGRGGAPGMHLMMALILLGAAAGAVVRGARRIPLARCARLADAALDGQDRLLSALYLDTDNPSPFARAAVVDAVRLAESLRPGAAVPARRPAGLPALGIATLALAGAALFPASSRAARAITPAPPPERRAPIPATALEAEREVARAAAETAARLGDRRLAALAAEFERALHRLASGTLSDPAALDLLRALETRAAEAARAAKRDGQAAEAAGQALEANAETRAAGEALAQTGAGGGGDERASAALGASATAHPAETARALASAAENMASAASHRGGSGETGDQAQTKDQPRRLARNDSSAGVSPESSPGEASEPESRHLEQLRRDLDDAAASCRDGDPSCRSRAEERARELAQLGRQGAARESLQRLQRSAGQLRARVGRGELGDSDAQAMRSFGRAADGKREAPSDTGKSAGAGEPAQGEDGEGTGSGPPGGDDPRGGAGDAETGAASAALAAEGGGASQDPAGTGNGIGHQPGGAPLGARRGDATSARGTETEVRIADGAGPGRAEVIGTAAGQGFASPGYARTFNDYAAAVEDALGATAVPEGKRYLVRRYFDLIRPRPPAPAPRSAR